MCTKQSDTQKVNIHPFGCPWWWIISSDFKPKFNAKHGKALFFIYLFFIAIKKGHCFYASQLRSNGFVLILFNLLQENEPSGPKSWSLRKIKKKFWWYRYIKFFSRNRDFKYHLIHLKNIFDTSIKISFNDKT